MIITPVTTTSARGTEILAGLRDRFQPADSAATRRCSNTSASLTRRP